MNAEILKALRGSIKKWERIATGRETDRGSSNCPLCKKFMFNDLYPCDGCPVKERTGMLSCRGTPYEKFQDISWKENLQLAGPENVQWDCVVGPLAQQAAIDEYEFLVSLLPPGEEP